MIKPRKFIVYGNYPRDKKGDKFTYRVGFADSHEQIKALIERDIETRRKIDHTFDFGTKDVEVIYQAFQAEWCELDVPRIMTEVA